MVELLSGTVAGAVCVSLNVSLAPDITEDMLISIFKSGILPQDWEAHINVFYCEQSAEKIRYFVREYNIPKDNFVKIHNTLPIFFQHYDFNELLKEVYG